MSAVYLSAACSQSGAGGQASLAGDHYRAVPPALRGGTAVIADYEYPATLNPLAAATDLELRLGQLCFVPLWALDDHLRAVPDLARVVPTQANGAVKVAANGHSMTVDVRLVPGLRWSDGPPITADDVIFTWRALSDPAARLVAPPGLAHLTGMTRRSATEVTWTFDGVFAPYLEIGAGLYVLPQHRLRDVPAARWAGDPFFQHPDAVSGPFRPAQVSPPARIVFSANPAYVDGRSAAGAYTAAGAPFTHAPYLDQVVVGVAPSRQAMVSDLRSGAADLGWHLSETDGADLGSSASVDVRTATSLRTEVLRPNRGGGRQTPWSGDPAVLEAMALAVDRAALPRLTPEGAGLPARGVFPRALGGQGAGSVVPVFSNPDRARQVLQQDGWIPAGDGVRSKAGRRLEFELTSLCGDTAVATALAGQLALVGADAVASCQPRGAFLEALGSGGYDAAVYSDEPGTDPADWALPGCADQAFARGAVTLDPSRRQAAYRAAELESLRQGCTIPLVEPYSFRAVSRNLRNLSPSPGPGGDTWNAADWWLSAG